jgi:hypothetical protein
LEIDRELRLEEVVSLSFVLNTAIEDYCVYEKVAIGSKNGVSSDSIWEKSGFVVAKWRHDVPWSWRAFQLIRMHVFQ